MQKLTKQTNNVTGTKKVVELKTKKGSNNLKLFSLDFGKQFLVID